LPKKIIFIGRNLSKNVIVVFKTNFTEVGYEWKKNIITLTFTHIVNSMSACNILLGILQKNVIVPIRLLECIRLHSRATTIFSFCYRTSTSNKTYAWVQNIILVPLYMYYAWKIVNKCT